jgi:hypothetical protein
MGGRGQQKGVDHPRQKGQKIHGDDAPLDGRAPLFPHGFAGESAAYGTDVHIIGKIAAAFSTVHGKAPFGWMGIVYHIIMNKA